MLEFRHLRRKVRANYRKLQKAISWAISLAIFDVAQQILNSCSLADCLLLLGSIAAPRVGLDRSRKSMTAKFCFFSYLAMGNAHPQRTISVFAKTLTNLHRHLTRPAAYKCGYRLEAPDVAIDRGAELHASVQFYDDPRTLLQRTSALSIKKNAMGVMATSVHYRINYGTFWKSLELSKVTVCNCSYQHRRLIALTGPSCDI